MNTYDINKIKLPNGDICNLRDQHVIIIKTVQETNLVHVEDAAEMPLKKLKVNLNSYQDLHGYDHPWPAGGGKNLADTRNISGTVAGITFTSDENGIISLAGTRDSSTGWKVLVTFSNFEPGNYVFSTNNNHVTCLLNYTQKMGTFTVSEGDSVKIALNSVYAGDTISDTGIKVQIEKGSTATSWTPYSNICPIIGQTSVVAHRTGKNLLDSSGVYSNNTNAKQVIKNSDGSFQLISNNQNAAIVYINFATHIPLIKNQLYSWDIGTTINCDTAQATIRDKDGNVFNRINAKDATASFTVSKDGCYLADAFIRFSSGQSASTTVYPMFCAGEFTSYEPYIDHQTVEANLGKNLLQLKNGTHSLSGTGVTAIIDSNGITLSGTAASGGGRTTQLSQPFELMPGTYILSGKNLNIQDYVMYIERVSDNSILGNSQNGAFTIQQKTNVYLGINAISGKVYSTTFYPQLEYGSTATSYVPYTDLGPIYGGTLDLATGELIVNKAEVDLGTLTWNVGTTGTTGKARYWALANGIKRSDSSSAIPSIISSSYVAASLNNTYLCITGLAVGSDNDRIWIYDDQKVDLTADAFTSYIAGTQLVYELATPITYHLTLQQITTLLGINNIWVEGKNVQCTYYINSDVTAQFKDYVKSDTLYENQIKPIETHTYTDIIGTENNNRYAGFFFAKVNSENYTDVWRVKMKITVTVPGQVNYNSSTITEIWGTENNFLSYKNQNTIKNTSYRPISYLSLFRPTQTGFQNGCRHWLGINLTSSASPTNTSYKRTCVVEVLDCENCTVELTDNVITPDNIPNRVIHTDWYASTNTDFNNFDCYTQGLRETGDDNSTTISRLNNNYAYYTAANALYRYQLVFTVTEDSITPLNTVNNTVAATKAMLTDVEFDPFGRIYYYDSATNIAANGLVNNAGLTFMYDLIDLRYTFNIVSGTATSTAMHLDSNKNVYLKVIPLENGKCKIASATPLVQALPTTQDGYWYILLGRQYDWYRMVLLDEHPVYEYYNGELRQRTCVNSHNNLIYDAVQKQKSSIIKLEHCGDRYPLDDLKVYLEPQQDLHGYANPWPGGGGKNLASQSVINGVTWAYNLKYQVPDLFAIFNNLSAGTYTVSFTTTIDSVSDTFTSETALADTCSIRLDYNSKVVESTRKRITRAQALAHFSAQNSVTFTLTENDVGKFTNIYTYGLGRDAATEGAPNGALGSATISNFQIESGSTATDYEPYSNICPISGFDSVKVTRCGKNLLPISTASAQGVSYSNGYYNVLLTTGSSAEEKKLFGNWNITSAVSFGLKSGTYIWSTESIPVNGGEACNVVIRISPHGTGAYEGWPTGTSRIINSDDKFFILLYFAKANTTYNCKIGIQLEPGSTATDYEPYQGNTYDITFPSEAGTVYGGTLDVTTGELVVDRICATFNGTFSGVFKGGYVSPAESDPATDSAFCLRVKPDYEHVTGQPLNTINPTGFCSAFKNESFYAVTNRTVNGFSVQGNWAEAFIFYYPGLKKLSDWQNWFTSNPTQICYELATPKTYQLTPQEITTLAGTNYLWSDSGDISATYTQSSTLLTALNSRLKNNYISKPFGTAKGDIIYYSDNNTPNRLSIGNEGQVLKVNASGLPSWSNDNNTNTTYTFTSGTNQFTATSSDGATQTVNVTPQIPNASTSSAGIVQLNTATNSNSTTQAATPSAVKSAYDLAASKTSNTGTVTSVTLTAGSGISITDNSVPITTIGGRTITNTGVTSVSQGTTNGTINVTTNGSTSAVAIRGLGSAAYTASTAYATAAQGGKADAAMPKSGGTFTGAVTLHSDPTTNLMAATKQYVDNNVSISDNLSSGTKIATITINGVNTDLYSPGTPQTISVTQSSSTPTLEFITSTNSSNSSTLTGVTTTALADGKMIVYRLAYALTGDPVTLTLSNTSGTSLGNYPVYIDGTTQCSDIYRAGTMLFLVFYNNKFTIVNPFGLAG